MLVEITAAETSPAVLKNVYEDRSIVTSVVFNNMQVEWDGAYKAKQKECKDAIDAVNKKRIPQRQVGPIGPEPDPFEWPHVRQLIQVLADKNPLLANSLIHEISNITEVKKIEVIKRLEM